jgi:hypothetical protein
MKTTFNLYHVFFAPIPLDDIELSCMEPKLGVIGHIQHRPNSNGPGGSGIPCKGSPPKHVHHVRTLPSQHEQSEIAYQIRILLERSETAYPFENDMEQRQTHLQLR